MSNNQIHTFYAHGKQKPETESKHLVESILRQKKQSVDLTSVSSLSRTGYISSVYFFAMAPWIEGIF